MSGLAATDDPMAGIDWHDRESLADFQRRAPGLTAADRALIVDQAIALLEGYYVHAEQKRQSWGVDAAARLRALKLRLPRIGSDAAFHGAMHAVLSELHDLHTNYVLPPPYDKAVAFLPFQIEACVRDATPCLIVSRVLDGFAHPDFAPGVVLESWNGVAIDRAVELLGARTGGANPEAERARAVAALTLRPMVRMPPPDEAWAEVGFRTEAGASRTLRADWQVFDLAQDGGHPPHPQLGLDAEGDLQRRARLGLFVQRGDDAQSVASTLPAQFRAWRVRADGMEAGYLRIRSFATDGQPEFAKRLVAEFARLLAALPQGGLILDVRDNIGGLVEASDRLLGMLTAREVAPQRVQFQASAAVLALCRAVAALDDPPVRLERFIPGLETALAAGRQWSDALPISLALYGEPPLRYPGRSVLIVNALCYSATDCFAASYQDHRIGRVLGTDRRTGAGGANVWTHAQLRTLLAGSGADLPALPAGTSLRLAIRRTLRLDGSPIEENGVTPDAVYDMTSDDVLSGNPGLVARAMALLAEPG